MSDNSDGAIEAYEKHALEFLNIRDDSLVGVNTVERWARSLKPNSNVLEIASGGGIPVTQTLLGAKLNLWAIDSSPALVAVFRDRYPDIPVACVSAFESDYFQRQYDAVISIGFMFLLNARDQIELINRVSRLLCSGGSFLFTAPVESGEWYDAVTAHKCLSLGRGGYLSALEKSGFKNVKCYHDSGNNNYYEAGKSPNEAGLL